MTTVIGCHSNKPFQKKLVRTDTIDVDSTDERYSPYGVYRVIKYQYNYKSVDTIKIDEYWYIDINYRIETYINEYKDTILIYFRNLTDFPKREE